MRGLLVTLTLVVLTASAATQSPVPKNGTGRAAPAAPADANGFRVGEEVLVNTGQGWMKGTILSANGNVYRIHTQIGIDTTKIYPDEIRRVGPPHGEGPCGRSVQPARSGRGERQRRLGAG